MPQSEVVKLIWDDKDALTEACRNVDTVIHAAGMNAQDCTKDPVAALEFNGVATARLVEATCKAGVNQLIYLSTAHVYSNPLQGTSYYRLKQTDFDGAFEYHGIRTVNCEPTTEINIYPNFMMTSILLIVFRTHITSFLNLLV